MAEKPLALDDVTVVSFAQIAQGPLAAQMLGDMGAEVIKVEPPGGEWMRREWSMANAYEEGQNVTFLTLNRNKKSVEVDLKDDEQREVLHELLDDADVLIENFRPGVMSRLGFGYEELSERNSELIYCSSTGYGREGPYADRPGQDLIIQGVSGIMSVTGRRDDPPTPQGAPVVDFYTGAYLAFAILAALHYRTRTGEGQHIDADLLSAAIHLQSMELGIATNTDGPPERSESGIGNVYYQAPYGVYETKDGYITLSLSYPSKIGEVLDIDEIKDISTWEAAYENRDEIKRAIEERTEEHETEYWLEMLIEEDIWCGPVNDYNDLIDHPQVKTNEMLQTVDHPVLGEITLTGVPVRLSKSPGRIRSSPPLLNEHESDVFDR